jgi:hypothetical protein
MVNNLLNRPLKGDQAGGLQTKLEVLLQTHNYQKGRNNGSSPSTTTG